MRYVFRTINKGCPDGFGPGEFCYVEAHDAALPFPVGFAFVALGGVSPPLVYYVLVADQHRRKGIATRLIAKCRERWPDVRLTEGISKAGRGLLRSVETTV